MLKTILASGLEDVLEGVIEGFFCFGDLEDGIQDNIVAIPDCIEVSLQDQPIRLRNDRVLCSFFLHLAALQDLQDQERVTRAVGNQVDQVL